MQVLGPLSKFRTQFWKNNSLVGNMQQSHSPQWMLQSWSNHPCKKVVQTTKQPLFVGNQMLFVANERNTTKLHNEIGKSGGEMSDEKTGLPNPDPILIHDVRFKVSAFAFFLLCCTSPLKSLSWLSTEVWPSIWPNVMF